MDELQIIKAEVERLKGSGCASPISVCNDLISFIESLQKEHASESIDDLEISCDAELCFAHTGCKFYNPNKKSNVNHCIGGMPLQLRQRPVSDDLNKVAENYANKHSVLLGFDCDSEPIQTGTDIKNAVIYGAQWQKQQMMKDAVEATIPIHGQIWIENNTKYKAGEKVKIITIKEG